MNVQGFNHVTINVTNLEKSLHFYQVVLGMKLIHKGRLDAYLEWGSAWYCLQEKPHFIKKQKEELGFDHVAFSISKADFDSAVDWLESQNVEIVKGPIKRGQGWSVYFSDPDGTVLELHTSNLQERMKVWK